MRFPRPSSRRSARPDAPIRASVRASLRATFLALGSALLGLTPIQAQAAFPPLDPSTDRIVQQAAVTWGLGQHGACATCRAASTLERTVLVDDIVHYRLELQVGPGPFDRIGLHRVVRERAPYRPRPSAQSVMIAHGINIGFAGTFLPGIGVAGADPAFNLPVYLAERGVDVWGIDFRWALVPPEVTEIGFMADWGLERDAADLRIALASARLIRWLTRTGTGRMDLVGYSRGGRISYTYLNDETEWPPALRHVDRFVQLDISYKTADAARQALACTQADTLQAEIDAGNVADNIAFLAVLGQLAQAAPDAPSPIFTGFTNRQAALLVGTTPPGGNGTFHLFAGTFDGPLPTGLRFTFEPTATNLLASSAAYQPFAGTRDALIVLCDDGRSDLDDHLGDIVVPVLAIGAAGGNGDTGTETFPFLGSTELASLVVALDVPGNELVDVGHGDILTMPEADTLVWQPIHDWIVRD